MHVSEQLLQGLSVCVDTVLWYLPILTGGRVYN